MPIIEAHVVEGLPEIRWSFPVWSWAPRTGHPAQAHGEPYPTIGWIVDRVYELLGYRWTRQYRQADAVRQWLQDYGMEVSYFKDDYRIEVKY